MRFWLLGVRFDIERGARMLEHERVAANRRIASVNELIEKRDAALCIRGNWWRINCATDCDCQGNL